MRQPPMAGQQAQVFNNADSFAQAFDEAWKKHEDSQPNHGLDQGAHPTPGGVEHRRGRIGYGRRRC